jgi:hypothetical protein
MGQSNISRKILAMEVAYILRSKAYKRLNINLKPYMKHKPFLFIAVLIMLNISAFAQTGLKSGQRAPEFRRR